jgi:type IV pilus biogenesis protein CpaD/CtpE
MKFTLPAVLATAALLSACASTPPSRTGFLGDYSQLQPPPVAANGHQ